MKKIILPLLCAGFLSLCVCCSKDDSDTNNQQASTSTTSSQTVTTYSTDKLVFDKDTVKQFTKSESVVSNHFTFKASHVTSDPVILISLPDASLPSAATSYTITQSGLTAGKCGMTITYNSRFYVASSGTITVTLAGGKSTFTLSNITCISTSDTQQRKASGTFTTN